MFPTLYEISPGGMGVHTYGLFIDLAHVCVIGDPDGSAEVREKS